MKKEDSRLIEDSAEGHGSAPHLKSNPSRYTCNRELSSSTLHHVYHQTEVSGMEGLWPMPNAQESRKVGKKEKSKVLKLLL